MSCSNFGNHLLHALAGQSARTPILVECPVQIARQLLGFQLQRYPAQQRQVALFELLNSCVQSLLQTSTVGWHFDWLRHGANLTRPAPVGKPGSR